MSQVGDFLFHWLWTNDSVGNFTASAIVFAVGGRYVWKAKVKPHLDHHKEQLRLLHEKVDSFSQTPPPGDS